MNLAPNEVIALAAVKDIYDAELSEMLEDKLDKAEPHEAEEALRLARNIPQIRAALVLTSWVDEVTYVGRIERPYVSRDIRASAEKTLFLLLGRLGNKLAKLFSYKDLSNSKTHANFY